MTSDQKPKPRYLSDNPTYGEVKAYEYGYEDALAALQRPGRCCCNKGFHMHGAMGLDPKKVEPYASEGGVCPMCLEHNDDFAERLEKCVDRINELEIQRPGREAALVEALRKATAHVGFLKSCVMSGESFYIEDLATLAEWSKEAQALISPPGLSTG